MEIIRDTGVTSGFRILNPVEGWPILHHCGEAHCSASHGPGYDQHPVFEFTYLVQGTLTIRAANRLHHLATGDMFVAHPGQVHGWLGDVHPHPPFHQFWLAFDLPNFSPAGKSLAQQLLLSHCSLIHQCIDVEPVLRGMIRWVLGQELGRQQVIASYLALFIELVHARLRTSPDISLAPGDANTSAHNSDSATSPPPARHRTYNYEIEKAVRYLQSNLRRRVTLPELAIFSGYAPPHLCRLFHQQVGVAPAAYHLRLRLEASREALLGTDVSIADIARDFGFNSSQHFSTRFREIFGLTPRDWQLKAQKPGP